MGVFKQFATNRELEKKLPLTFAANPDGTIPTIYVRRVFRDDASYQAAFTRITKPYKNDIEHQTIDPAIDAKLMQRLCAETTVVGWDNWRLPYGVAGGKGEGPAEWPTDSINDLDIPFSVDAVCETFRIMPDIWRHVVTRASDPDAYKAGELEEMAKNW
jgi:hypothetical protein